MVADEFRWILGLEDDVRKALPLPAAGDAIVECHVLPVFGVPS